MWYFFKILNGGNSGRLEEFVKSNGSIRYIENNIKMFVWFFFISNYIIGIY